MTVILKHMFTRAELLVRNIFIVLNLFLACLGFHLMCISQ